MTPQDLADDLATRLLSRLGRHHRPTYDHSLRVGKLARQLATHLDLAAGSAHKITRAALLHDVGKVAVPIDILDKPTDLTEQEWVYLDLHCEVGADLLRRTKLLEDESYLVRHHHRWYAANNGLCTNYVEERNAGIDLIAVCDAYDAMISERPYSPGLEKETALQHIEREAGMQFNPRMVKSLREVLGGTTIMHAV